MDSVLGVHEAALLFKARRMDVLAANLANADTPHFKARDVEFASVLERTGVRAAFAITHPRHIAARSPLADPALQYRVPHQPAQDGNTVETDLELARYAENAVGYQASLMFINGKIATLRAALTGAR